MSSRPHGRGLHHRGGYGHHRGVHWVGYRGGHRGGGGGHSDYHPPPHHIRGGRSPRPPPPRPPPPRHRPDPEKLLAALGPDAQLALTTALINTVLKTTDKEGRGSFREDGREGPYRHREPHREGRGGGYFKEDMRPRRQYAMESPRGRYESRWSEDGGRRGGGQHHHHFDREKSGPYQPQHVRYGHRYQPMGQGIKRRPSPSPNAHPGSYKRQRMEMDDGDRSSHDNYYHREDDYMEEDGGSGEGSHGGDSKWSWQREEERRARSSTQEDSGQRERARRSESEGGGGGKDSEGGGGVQVTIRADGERAVNSDGHVRRVAGRLFVDLRCPHCPNQKSITFKEYKIHLTSDHHKSQLKKLARKHIVVLRKIRLKQRQEQKEIEDKWREDNPEEFKTAVSRFCNTCKLAFKCIGTGIHNRSKLHRMQRHYLHPRCGLCRITFPSRMVYEHHIASINHLRVRTATLDNQGGEGSGERARRMDHHAGEEDRPEDLDLANFMTVDSVGEDDEEEGSEHEEITGGLDAVEAAEKAATHNDTDDELERGAKRRRKREEDDEVTPLLEADWNKEQPEDEEEEGSHKPMGTDYVRRVEAYYCSLCYKIIRTDSSLGSRAVQRHCRSVTHLSHYWDHHPAPHQDEDEDDKMHNEGGEEEEEEEEEDKCSIEEEDGVGSLELEMDQEQDKLWDEVDKGLSELRGEILTEIEGESIKENVKQETLKEKDNDKNKESQETEEAPEEEEEQTPSESKGSSEKGEDSNHNTTEGKVWEEVGDDFTE